MYVDVEPTSYGVRIVPQYEFGIFALSLQELSRFFYDELDYRDCLEVCGAFENAARLLREVDAHGNVPTIKVHVGEFMVYLDSNLTGYSLPYLVDSIEYAEAMRDTLYSMAAVIAERIGEALPQAPWLLTEVA